MLPLMINVLPAPPPVGTQSALPQALLPAGVSDMSATVRLQLPVAVVASGIVPPFSINTPQAAKVAVRSLPVGPSSQLAAQFIDQIPQPTEAELEVFAALPRPAEKSVQAAADEDDDFIASIRIARGDVPQETPAPVSEPAAPAATPPAPPVAAEEAVATPPSTLYVNPQTVPLTTRQISLPLVVYGKKPGVGQVRGLAAYQLAETRNAGMINPDSVTKIL